MTNGALKVLKRRGGNGQRQETAHEVGKRLETRVFDLYRERYGNLTELARTMGISVSQIYRVKQRKRHIMRNLSRDSKSLPGYKLDDLFCIVPDGRRYDRRQ